MWGCQRPVHQISLFGFDSGRQTMKLEYLVYKQKYPDGSLGYRLEDTLIHGVGNMSHHRITRTAWLDRDFCLRRTESERIRNDQRSTIHSWVEDGVIHILTENDGQDPSESTVEYDAPVYIELHPLIYAAELRQPGWEKAYPILFEPEAAIRTLKVRYLGPEEILENKQSYSALHFQLQVISSPNEYDDYYIDPQTKKILKIQFGRIKFIPDDWVE